MRRYIVKRILQMIPVIILVSIFSFMIIHFAPGDPINMYIRQDMTQQEIDELRVDLGLDGTIAEQYLAWLSNICRGNWGNSLINHQPVAKQIFEKLPATLLLMGTSFVLSILMSIPLGLVSGMKKNKAADQFISIFAYIGISIPAFWLALMLIIIFSLNLHWLPSNGMRTVGSNSVLDILWHLILPGIVLSVGNTAVFTRYIRSNTITQLEEEYVLTAKAKGVSKRRIMTGHVLKNCLLPIITIAGMNLASLVTGSFIIESVFGWPGMGTLGMSAINSRDYPMIMGFTMLSCVILIIGNFIADLLYGVADPRIKQEVKKIHES
ncbi:ABC transporter permease [Bariatricus sp. HCP28S3_E4]|uniref:ABC transporter permease n=1 Tax=Lachnospiraceae TaxID=186803 RepID=UPI002A8C1784|nr:ABC transporter permease [Bariatricus sp.]